MYHEVLEKRERWLWLVIIIVNGVYYGRNRHGLGDFDTGLAGKMWIVAQPQPIPPLEFFSLPT